MDSGNTAWVLASAALVMLMTPGLAFFYGGLVRGKNVLTTMFHSFFMVLLISVVWVLWGYTIAFGDDKGGLIGGLNYLGFKGVGVEAAPLADSIPHAAFAVFQMMFANAVCPRCGVKMSREDAYFSCGSYPHSTPPENQ